ncbi:hypothetical protein, partial [Flammeovirga sp. SJP92]|uniref:hypothetical protein n=1 Tax=Flammeovirga sp. SJP92 TaxID=1775430 RepID=UPI00352923A1
KSVKPFARKIESEDSVISIDDTISEKPHSSINTIVNYHFDTPKQFPIYHQNKNLLYPYLSLKKNTVEKR